AVKNVEIMLGDDARHVGGLVIQDGVLQSLNASITADFTVAGLHIDVDHLTVAYDHARNNFSLAGSLGVTFAGHTFGATLGDATHPGIVIEGGALKSLNI